METNKRISLPLGKVCSVEFVGALTRLAALRDVLSGKDSYALMRTLDVLEPELDPHKRALDMLLRKYGAHGSLDALRTLRTATAANAADHETAMQELNQRIARLEPGETLSISPADAGWTEFIRERDELDAKPVELFLDHKISLAVDRLPAGAMSALDLRALKEIVEFDAPHLTPTLSPPKGSGEGEK